MGAGRALRRGSTLTEQAAEAIITMIHEEGLQPGDKLPPSHDLAERFGVSRTVVREALADLTGRGVVSRPGGRDVIVGAPGAAQLTDLFGFRLQSDSVNPASLMELRLVVEVASARLAAERIDGADLGRLGAALEAMRVATDEPSFTAGDIEFHRVLAQASGNLLIQLLIESLGPLFKEFRSRSYHGVERRGVGFDHTIREHETLLHALERHNPKAAAKAMADHLLAVADLLDVEVSPTLTR